MHLSYTSELCESQHLYCARMSQHDPVLQKKPVASFLHRTVHITVLYGTFSPKLYKYCSTLYNLTAPYNRTPCWSAHCTDLCKPSWPVHTVLICAKRPDLHTSTWIAHPTDLCTMSWSVHTVLCTVLVQHWFVHTVLICAHRPAYRTGIILIYTPGKGPNSPKIGCEPIFLYLQHCFI